MKDPLEFDSETIFKLEALLANSVRTNRELGQKLADATKGMEILNLALHQSSEREEKARGLIDRYSRDRIARKKKLAIAVEAMTEAKKTIMPMASADYEYYAIGLLDIALEKIGAL